MGRVLNFSPVYKQRGGCADIKRMGGRGALRRKEAVLLAVKSQARLVLFVTFFFGVVWGGRWEEGYPRLALSSREPSLATRLHLQMPHRVHVLALGRGSTHRNNPINCSLDSDHDATMETSSPIGANVNKWPELNCYTFVSHSSCLFANYVSY